MIESVVACGCWCTAASTATRGRVTRRPTPRNMRSKSAVVGTIAVFAIFLTQSRGGAGCGSAVGEGGGEGGGGAVGESDGEGSLPMRAGVLRGALGQAFQQPAPHP